MAGRRLVESVPGPLAAFAVGYDRWLTAQGLCPRAVRDRIWQLSYLSEWLVGQGLSPGELDRCRAEEHVAGRRAAGCLTWVAPSSLRLPLEYLREIGVVPVETALPAGREIEALLAAPHRGQPLTTRAFELRLDKHTATAACSCPTLKTKRVTPHVLRHTNAMLLRAENVDIYTIALWLQHASTKSTEIYLHADNKLKQQAIERDAPTGTPPGRHRPNQLVAFLETL